MPERNLNQSYSFLFLNASTKYAKLLIMHALLSFSSCLYKELLGSGFFLCFARIQKINFCHFSFHPKRTTIRYNFSPLFFVPYSTYRTASTVVMGGIYQLN